ncbi:rCG32164, partial [Rattus norvegicus]
MSLAPGSVAVEVWPSGLDGLERNNYFSCVTVRIRTHVVGSRKCGCGSVALRIRWFGKK